jgi:hypothetical protein
MQDPSNQQKKTQDAQSSPTPKLFGLCLQRGINVQAKADACHKRSEPVHATCLCPSIAPIANRSSEINRQDASVADDPRGTSVPALPAQQYMRGMSTKRFQSIADPGDTVRIASLNA